MGFRVYLFIFILSLGLVGCDGSVSIGGSGSGGRCSLLIESLDFGDVAIGEDSIKSVSLNCVEGTVVEFAVLDQTGSFSTEDISPMTAVSGGIVNIKMQFSPIGVGNAKGVLRLAVGGSLAEVELKGNGVSSPLFAPTLSKTSIDFGSVRINTVRSEPVYISNLTGKIFEITSINAINETSFNVFNVNVYNCLSTYLQGSGCEIAASYVSSVGSKDRGRIEIKYKFENEDKVRAISIALNAIAY